MEENWFVGKWAVSSCKFVLCLMIVGGWAQMPDTTVWGHRKCCTWGGKKCKLELEKKGVECPVEVEVVGVAGWEGKNLKSFHEERYTQSLHEETVKISMVLKLHKGND